MTESVAAESPNEAAAEIIREIERGRLRALVASDMDTAQRMHATEFQLITPRGHSLSKQQYLDAVAEGEIRYLLWEPGEINVRIRNGFALIRYRAILQLEVNGDAKPKFECWHTDSYELREDGWQVVWSQATKIE